MTPRYPATGIVLIILAACSLPSASLADMAVLREKGPKSGSVFSNVGAAAKLSEGVRIQMKSADVKIRLKKDENNTLSAECSATFTLVDSTPNGIQGEYLVAFPATGLKSKVLSVDRFRVSVDGKEPPVVLRHSIYISKRESKLLDTPIVGQLDARFAPQSFSETRMVALADGSGYTDCYLWSQSIAPGAVTKVNVTYVTKLTPQTIQYKKSYEQADDDSEVIPFEFIDVDGWDNAFYFFDYVLRSGATWDGNIESEVIEISSDPELKLSPYRILIGPRRPSGYQPTENLPIGWSFEQSFDAKNNSTRIEFKNFKPSCDVLVTIRASDLGQN